MKNSRFLNRFFSTNWCGMKNSRFLNHFFSSKWCGMKNSRFLNHFFFSEMALHENLTFFEPFLFYAKCRCEKNSRFLNHFDRFSARRLLSNEAFEKLLVFVTVQNLVARKTYVLGTIQLNHIIPLNVVARETYVLETIFRPRFEKLKVF